MQNCKTRQDAGFTLIEVILSLILASIMAAVAGMGIVSFAKGFVLVKKSTQTAQKAQLALARLTRELTELKEVQSGSGSTTIKLESKSGNNREIGMDDGKIKIAESGTALADGDVLIDNVASFTLAYYKDYQSDPKVLWVLGTDNINLLTAIRFEFTISGVGGSFSTIVSPRNI